jgi:uncharacterized protein
VIAEAATAIAGVCALRRMAHRAILRGLRAPRLVPAHAPGDARVASEHVHEVRIAGAGGKSLFGWLVSPPGTFQGLVPAVVAMHGWGSNAAMMWQVVPPLHAAGFAVLLIDARCHGRSDDEVFTSMPRFAEDISAGLAWLRQQPGIAPDRLALVGHSVGAAAALLHASVHRDVRAVVSLAAFAHPREVMRAFMAEKRVPYPLVGWYVMRHVQRVIGTTFNQIAPVNTIAGVRCPVLVVHGRTDGVVPMGDAKRLVERSARAQLLLVDGSHDLRDALALHAATLVDFLHAACMTAETPPKAPG